MYDDYSDGLDVIDYDELETECSETAYQASQATGDRDIVIGVHPNGRNDYELWVDGGAFGTQAHYFGSFEEVREAIKEKYPTADWEDLGW
jgi:hypothetical protein